MHEHLGVGLVNEKMDTGLDLRLLGGSMGNGLDLGLVYEKMDINL